MRIPRLSWYEWSLLPEAFFRLAQARWQVLHQPTVKWLPQPTPGPQPPTPNPQPNKVQAIARVVEGLGHRVPWKSVCLDQALAAHRMFKRRRIAHLFHFGVHKKSPDEMLAHAWISSGGSIVLGETKAIDYKEVSKLRFE